MARIETLQELSEAVRGSIGSGTAYGILNARLLILIGVNLRDISPKQNRDALLLRKVMDTLARMGIRLEVSQ
jgi:hypothetical protein